MLRYNILESQLSISWCIGYQKHFVQNIFPITRLALLRGCIVGWLSTLFIPHVREICTSQEEATFPQTWHLLTLNGILATGGNYVCNPPVIKYKTNVFMSCPQWGAFLDTKLPLSDTIQHNVIQHNTNVDRPFSPLAIFSSSQCNIPVPNLSCDLSI